MTDYDDFAATYDELRTTGTFLLRRDHIQTHVKPLLTTVSGKGANILDLGCGSGAFSRDLLDWGAESVVGVDVSRQMIKRAEEQISLASGKIRQSIKYHVADAKCGQEFPGSPFDLVFGVWIFNYASCKQELVQMFRTASVNLKPGGKVFAVMPPVSQDPRPLIEAHMSLDREKVDGIAPIDVQDVEDGILVHHEGHMPSGSRFSIHTFHIKQSVVEESAREAGLIGEVTWIPQSVSEERMRHPESLSMTRDQLETYNRLPNHALLMIDTSY